MAETTTPTALDQILDLARRLSSKEELRLIDSLAQLLLQEAESIQPTRRSLRGILADLGPAPSAEEVEIAFDRRIANAMRLVDRAAVPDFPDRIIAATAVHLGIPLISRDGKIRMSNVTTIW